MTTMKEALRGIDLSVRTVLVVWRIESFKLVPIPPASYGTFMNGDSYVVLSKTTSEEGISKFHIYQWLGSATTQDESASSAILGNQIDQALGGSPDQVRVVQGQEPDEFKALFSGGLNFHQGGVASGFKSASDAIEAQHSAKFFHVGPDQKGAVQVTEVKPEVASMCKNACYLLDDESSRTIFIWYGAAGLKAKSKAMDTANSFRVHRGKMRLLVVETYDLGTPEAQTFFSLLGAHSPAAPPPLDDLPIWTEIPPSALKSKTSGTDMSVLCKLDPEGKGCEDLLPPPSKSHLDSSTILGLVSNGQAYLWLGSKAPPHAAPNVLASRLAAHAGLPNAAGILVVRDRMETPLFMAQFSDWNAPLASDYKAFQVGMAANMGVPSPDAKTPPPIDYQQISGHMAADAKAALEEHKQQGSSHAVLRASQVYGSDGRLTVWIIRGPDLEEVPEGEHGQFFDGESYIVLLEYVSRSGDPRQTIYFWQGVHATNHELGAAALLATNMHNSKFKGTSALLRVAQGEEPQHLVGLFRRKGGMVVHKGQRPAEVHLPLGAAKQPHLYKVKAEAADAVHAVEVDLAARSLSSGDSFILTRNGQALVWNGRGSSSEERAVASGVASALVQQDVTTLEEGAESEDFCASLPGWVDEPYSKNPSSTSSKDSAPPMLFHLRDTSGNRGGVSAQVYLTFSQSTLEGWDAMLLDAGKEVMIWVGKQAAAVERVRARKVAEAYLKATGRAKASIVDIQAGDEPPFFTQHFRTWDQAPSS